MEYSGALGSNTGDQYHELFALLKILELLQPNTQLTAVGVEGVETDKNSDHDWAGVDCTLYYGGQSLESSYKVEFIQLKYSASNPAGKWSVARLVDSSATSKNNSVIRKMANDFKEAIKSIDVENIRIQLVSNQQAAKDIRAVLNFRDISVRSEEDSVNYEKLRKGSGLGKKAFMNFLKVLDFSECGKNSRFAYKEKVLGSLADQLGDDFLQEMKQLHMNTREMMLPESQRVATRTTIMSWLGVRDEKGLFPCKPVLKPLGLVVGRAALNDLLVALNEGQKLILVHGDGGCGKTTLLQQAAAAMEDSYSVIYDCFGGGSYVYADDKRHLAKKAFLQIVNDVSVCLNLPLQFPRNSKYPFDISRFIDQLEIASNILHEVDPKKTLTIMIDAVDNSVAAAKFCDPPEQPFIYDFLKANLERLPANIRFIVSCRTARRDLISFPKNGVEIECLPFSLEETVENLSLSYPEADQLLAEQLHLLSNGVPRVQGYALEYSEGLEDLLIPLMPKGKGLDDVFDSIFETALKRMGRPDIFDDFVSALSVLPAPIELEAIAEVLEVTKGEIKDIVSDLAPGLIIREDSITIADEDYADFIGTRGVVNRQKIIEKSASHFLKTNKDSSYSAVHIADFLVKANRATEILGLLEDDPQISAVTDPVESYQIQLNRMRLSLHSHKNSGSKVDVIKTVLHSAQATYSDSMISRVLDEHLGLSVEFAYDSVHRKVLMDSELAHKHGSFLAHEALRQARRGRTALAREKLHYYELWLDSRRKHADSDGVRNNWSITDNDIAALTETVLELGGTAKAFHYLMRWRPVYVKLKVAISLVPRLIASGKAFELKELLDSGIVPKPWDLVLIVNLLMAGEDIAPEILQSSLRRVSAITIPDIDNMWSSNGMSWKADLLDVFILACEQAYAFGVDTGVVLQVVERILKKMTALKNRLFKSEIPRIDALIRCWLLSDIIRGHEKRKDNFDDRLVIFKPDSEDDQKQSYQSSDFEELKRFIGGVTPIYVRRVDILRKFRSGETIDSDSLEGMVSLIGYWPDRDYETSRITEKAAQSVMRLLCVKELKGVELFGRCKDILGIKCEGHSVTKCMNLIPLMALRVDEYEDVLDVSSKCFETIKTNKEVVSDKMASGLQLAWLLLPTSPDDAEIFFKESMEMASGIDTEILDQVNFLGTASLYAKINNLKDSAVLCDNFADIVGHISDYLDRLPWEDFARTLSTINIVYSLAAISRWSDRGVVSIGFTLPEWISVALQLKKITPELAYSLSTFFGGCSSELRDEIVSGSHDKEDSLGPLLEEMAKDTLLYRPQNTRHDFGREILSQYLESSSSKGRWGDRLEQTIDFLDKHGDSKKNTRDDARHLSYGSDRKELTLAKLEIEDKYFSSAERILEVLEIARKSDLDDALFESCLLAEMMTRSSGPRFRAAFLNAVADLPIDDVEAQSVLDLFRNAIEEWGKTPAVQQWIMDRLPEGLVKFFENHTWWDYGDSSWLYLLDKAGLDSDGRFKVFRDSLINSKQSLTSRQLFVLAGRLVQELNSDEVNELFIWYLGHIHKQIPEDDRFCSESLNDFESVTESVARFLFVMMGDIDKHIRWEAAHVLRKLARLGCHDVLKATVAQYSRDSDGSFLAAGNPFYHLSAKLWLVISLHRIAFETPEDLSIFKNDLLDFALSSELPHVAIREYSKRTLLQLYKVGAIELSAVEYESLDKVNSPIARTSKGESYHGRGFGHDSNKGRRFHFDSLDTLQYWYDIPLSLFPSVTEEDFLNSAESWIVDKWQAPVTGDGWAIDNRQNRFRGPNWRYTDHRHGSYPRKEVYVRYLEWNAMHCVVGELLQTHSVLKNEDYYYSFEEWLEKCRQSQPDRWISDNKGATPLESELWFPSPHEDEEWIETASDDDFFKFLGVSADESQEWVAINADYSFKSPNRECLIQINTALVAPQTAPALVRALQSTDNHYSYGIPAEDESFAINSLPFSFVGWLRFNNHDLKFDEHDPLRYEVGMLAVLPGTKLNQKLTLDPADNAWMRKESKEVVVKYESWCDEPESERENYYVYAPQSQGRRLWAKADFVREFLKDQQMDLVCKVFVRKTVGSSRDYSKNEVRKHVRIILLRADGTIYQASGDFGTW